MNEIKMPLEEGLFIKPQQINSVVIRDIEKFILEKGAITITFPLDGVDLRQFEFIEINGIKWRLVKDEH